MSEVNPRSYKPSKQAGLLTGLNRAIHFAYKLVRLHAPMPPTRVEVSCRMFGQNLALGSTCCNQWFYTIANGHDHVAERFDACTVRYLSARWHDAERTIRPSVECVHQP